MCGVELALTLAGDGRAAMGGRPIADDTAANMRYSSTSKFLLLQMASQQMLWYAIPALKDCHAASNELVLRT